jgi:hypothetical protein
MPRGDGTGPYGQGPGTGRGLGRGGGVGAEWVETALAQVPAGIVCVLVVGQRFLTRQASLAIT